MIRDELGDRMKEYEAVSKNYLMKKCPVCLRIDGKAFHTFTKGFKRPFDDEILLESMRQTMKYLCENIQGVVLAYTESDEITLILTDYNKINTDAWFDYNVQKLCSIAASMATMAFNKFFAKNINEYDMEWKCSLTPQCVEIQKAHYDYMEVLNKAIDKGAMFDARAFNLPLHEVCNELIWRQNDATRNSIQQVAHTYFSDEELHKKNLSEIQDMLMLQKGINWNDYPTHLKRGSCCIKEMKKDENAGRKHWVIDKEIPIFTKDRDYIDNRVYIGIMKRR